MFHEGQSITSIGDGSDGVPLGTHGRILALAAGSGHVQWLSGPLTNRVTFVPQLEEKVAPASRRVQAQHQLASDGLEDSLEVGPVHPTGARHLMATGGARDVLYSLSAVGALHDVGDVAEDTLSYVEARLRQAPGLQVHLAELDEEDRSEVLRMASRELLHQAFGGHDE